VCVCVCVCLVFQRRVISSGEVRGWQEIMIVKKSVGWN
jgi:hypothetical protein